MYANLSILALCAAASIQEVAAASLHRHIHPKREVVYASTEVVVVTEYVTTTVTEGDEPTSVAAPSPTVDSNAEIADYSEQAAPAVGSSVLSARTSSSSTPTVEPTTPVAAPEPSIPTTTAAAAEPSVATTSPTTLATAIKSSVPALGLPALSPTESSSAAVSPTNVAKVGEAPADSSSAAAPSSSPGTSKRGAAYNDVNLVETLLGMSKDISWAYNWGSDSGGLDDKVTYCPMLWSAAPEHSDDWDAKASAAISKGSNCLLSFNEPDFASQANMAPDVAATQHIKFMNTYAGQARIGSPAISSTVAANMGIEWLKQFLIACDGKCQIDFCTAHWYGPGGSDGAELFLQHVKDVHTNCDNKPVWMTEYAADSGDVDQFMRTVIEKLESDEFDFVEKYSYFMAKEGSLFDSSTTLSSFGKIFAGVSS
ncbi:glycosyl hydrolase catalytic core-domain-containing protein [Xylariaceae sp. FL0662B]|nr:glycosyl hydrolase catalytic core-domain-containing protein [Xylariaceae sp. FL0662B]